MQNKEGFREKNTEHLRKGFWLLTKKQWRHTEAGFWIFGSNRGLWCATSGQSTKQRPGLWSGNISWAKSKEVGSIQAGICGDVSSRVYGKRDCRNLKSRMSQWGSVVDIKQRTVYVHHNETWAIEKAIGLSVTVGRDVREMWGYLIVYLINQPTLQSLAADKRKCWQRAEWGQVPVLSGTADVVQEPTRWVLTWRKLLCPELSTSTCGLA